MNENKYTPEPWRTDAECGFPQDIHDSKGNLFLRCGSGFDNEIYGEANARRIVACVNACAGFSTETLELIASVGGMQHKMTATAAVASQRDELLSDLAEAKRSAEFNFEQYQDVGRLLHEECEKTEKLLAAMIHIQQVACSGSPELGIAIDAIASVKGKQ